ncbi:unnamed protein product [Choristocarpus tenellus]
MTEASQALYLLQQERSIAEEVIAVLQRCPRGTRLDAATRGAIKGALSQIQAKESVLEDIVRDLEEHQQRHVEVKSLQKQVQAGEESIREYARRMTKAEAALVLPLKEAKDMLEIGKRSESAIVKVGDIVDYAQRVSGTTSAPSYWQPSMAMVGFAPPAPRAEMMRAGALSALAMATGSALLSKQDLEEVAVAMDRPLQSQAPEQEGDGGNEPPKAGGISGVIENKVEQNKQQAQGEAVGKRGERHSAASPAASRAQEVRGHLDSVPLPSPVKAKKPKIVLDLDDLDSSDSEDSEDDD